MFTRLDDVSDPSRLNIMLGIVGEDKVDKSAAPPCERLMVVIHVLSISTGERA